MTVVHQYTPHTFSVQPTAVQSIPAPATTPGAAFKPKKAGTNKSHIIFVLDGSGSMQSCRDETIAGFNEYLSAQKVDAETTGIDTFVSLYKFDGYKCVAAVNHVAVADVIPLSRDTYNPVGGTNLHDAMGGVMMQINTELAATKKSKRESVIVAVLTDGSENMSHVFTATDVRAMVEKAEAKNWGFMFLGANIDAFATGATLGFGSHNTIQYDTSATTATILNASAMTSRMKSAYSRGTDTNATYLESAFTDGERARSVGSDE